MISRCSRIHILTLGLELRATDFFLVDGADMSVDMKHGAVKHHAFHNQRGSDGEGEGARFQSRKSELKQSRDFFREQASDVEIDRR